MAAQKLLKLSLALVLVIQIIVVANAQYLSLDYYKKSCPKATKIVRKVTQQFVKNDPTLAAGLLRINFHDCFVRGCDASVLLKPTDSNSQTELTAIPNQSLRGMDVIDAIKSEIEKVCPGVVSCSDIIALSARDAVKKVHGPSWDVPCGRRDGKVSLASETVSLPSPFADINGLKQNFMAKGMNAKNLVVLSGAHTIGVGHCQIIAKRLFNFTGAGDTDPSLDPDYATYLKNLCQQNLETAVGMDTVSPLRFDNGYYVTVAKNRGFFTSDATLLDDQDTKNYVTYQVKTQGSTFFKDFSESMMKLNLIEVLTGDQGEIRKNCGYVNQGTEY